MVTPTLPSGPSPSKTMDLSDKMKVTPLVTSDTSPSIAQPLLDPMAASIPTQPPQSSACPPRFSLKDYIAEAMGKYKDELVALSTTADLNLPALVAVARRKHRKELAELLDKMIELANIYKQLSPWMEDTLQEYVVYLKDIDLRTLRVKAMELNQINLDKLLSDISGLKNAYEKDYDSVLLFAIKALKHYEGEVITCLQNPRLFETLVEDAHKAKLIPEKLRNIFASLDCNVSHSLKCRYLILHVNKKIANDPESFDMWLSLLYRHEGIHSLLDKVKAYYEQTLSMDQLTSNFCLEDKHVSHLTLILVSDIPCSRYWKKIAIFLDLPHDLIASIQCINDRVCLRQVLHVWITQKYDCSKPPILENLESSVSRAFGLVCLNKDLLKKELGLRRKISSVQILDQSQDIKINNESNRLNILLGVIVSSVPEASLSYQWYKDGEKLNDAEKTHNCSGSEDCIINIFADSLILEGSYTCRIQQGDQVITSEPIVLTVGTPLDKYTKKLKAIYDAKSEVPEDTWPPVSINTYINLALIKQQDINNAGEYARYTIRGDADDVFKDKESIEYESVFDRLGNGARLLIEGRPGSGKTTLVHKVSQDWAKDKLKFHRVRLLFLVHLRGFLSDPKIKLHNILECYFNDDRDSAVYIDDIMKYADEHNGLGLCFILDGLDEYLPKTKGTYIHRLINQSLLPRALVIVASRPAAVADFRTIASRRIEVLGFLKKQISEYVKEYKFSDVSKYTKLLRYLNHHPNVHHMCYLPIHAAMVCYLCRVDRSLPETETGIYKEFTIYFLLRALCQLNDDEDIYIDSIESLPSSERESYMKICKLAFEMTVSSKQVMKQKDVQNRFNFQSNRDYFGLITVDKIALKYGFQKLYTFLHLTFQEFLTAYHISKLEEEEQTKLINEYGNAKQMQNVWKFYCGLVKFDDNHKFRSLVNNTQTGTLYKVQCSFESQQPSTCDSIVENGSLSFKDKFLTPSDFIAMAFVISHATQGTLNRLVFHGCTLGPEGIEVLVKKAGLKLSLVTSLCFHGLNCAAEQLKLVNKLIHVLPSLEILDITNTQLVEEAVTALIGSSKHFNLHPNLQVLKIGAIDENDLLRLLLGFKSQCSKEINFWFLDHSKKCLLPMLSLPFYFCSIGNLSDVNMSFCNLQLVEVKILSDDLKINFVCNRLSLIGCGITDEGVKVLSGGIGCSNIKILELSLNHIGDEGALALVHSIESCLSLHTLNMSCNCVGDDGAMAIAKAIVSKHDKNFNLHLWNNNITKHGADALLQIKKDINFKSLDIYSRNIGSSGAAAVSLFLAKYKSEGQAPTDASNDFQKLFTLNLSCNSIGNVGAKELAGTLKIGSHLKLTSLNLSSNSIGFDGTTALADTLKYCTALGTLDISNNNICVAGVKALACALKHCVDLHTLNISCNRLQDGAVALSDLIKHCPNLCKLIIADNSIGVHSSPVLADAIKYCKNLHILDISRNNIGVKGATFLADAIKYCKNLHILDISHNDIGVKGAIALSGAIKQCVKLQTLHVAHRKIGTRACCTDLHTVDTEYSAQAAIKSCNNLHTLDVSHNKIGRDGAIAFADAIKHSSNLCTLELSHNNIGQDGIKAIAGAIGHCSNLCLLGICDIEFPKSTLNVPPHLEHLRYHLNEQYMIMRQSILQSLSVAIKHNYSNLHKLDIAQNSIGGNGMKVLADAIKHCSSLHTLILGRNNIGPEGAVVLADAIKCCSNLQTFDIGYNNLGDKGVMVLANALEHCSCLHTLIVSCNEISKYGILTLARAIKCHSSKLQVLDISFCSGYNTKSDFGLCIDTPWVGKKSSGVVALTDAIMCCSNLHTLVINNNRLTGSDVDIVSKALTKCSNLRVLDISHNDIGDDGAQGLADIMKYCRNLQSLDINHNEFGKSGASVIAGSIKYCHDLNTLKFDGIGSIGERILKKAWQ